MFFLKTGIFKEKNISVQKLFAFSLFCLTVVYSLLRSLKEGLFLSMEGVVPETLIFLKLFFVFPLAFLSSFFFASLDWHPLKMHAVFLLFFLISITFSFLGSVNFLENTLWGINVSFVLGSFLYVLGDLWGPLLIATSFWNVVHFYIGFSGAKRAFVFLGLITHTAYFISGFLGLYFFEGGKTFGVYEWIAILFFGFFSLGPLFFLKKGDYNLKKNDEELSFLEPQKALLLVTVIVFCYNFFIASFEMLWKIQILEESLERSLLMSYLHRVNLWSGLCGLFLGFLLVYLWRNISVKALWLIPPLSIAVLMGVYKAGILLMAVNPLTLALPLVVFSKAQKYIFFDPGKELLFRSMPSNFRQKALSWVEGFVVRSARAMGLLTIEFVVGFYSDLFYYLDIPFFLIFTFIIIWLFFVFYFFLFLKQNKIECFVD